jgi:hypothetical protein
MHLQLLWKCVIVLLQILQLLPSTYAFQTRVPGSVLATRWSPVSALDDSDELLYKDVKSTGERGMKGFYRRPSKAIEQGGGFFIPGLEGERVRLLSAFALLVALLVNRVGVTEVSSRVLTSEAVGAFVVFILFSQGLSKLFEPEAVIEVSSSSYLVLLQSSSTACVSIARAIVQTSEDVNYVLALRTSDLTVTAPPPPSSSSSASLVLAEFAPVGSPPLSAELCGRISSQARPLVGKVIPANQLLEAAQRLPSPFPSSVSWFAVLGTPNDDVVWIVGSAAAKGDGDLKSSLSWLTELVAFPF